MSKLCLTFKVKESNFHENDCAGETQFLKGFSTNIHCGFAFSHNHFEVKSCQTACQNLHYPQQFFAQSHSVVKNEKPRQMQMPFDTQLKTDVMVTNLPIQHQLLLHQ